MIDLSAFPDLAGMDLGPMQPKPTSIEGNQTEAARAMTAQLQ